MDTISKIRDIMRNGQNFTTAISDYQVVHNGYPHTNLEEIAQYLTQDFLKRLRSQIFEKGVELIRTPLILI